MNIIVVGCCEIQYPTILASGMNMKRLLYFLTAKSVNADSARPFLRLTRLKAYRKFGGYLHGISMPYGTTNMSASSKQKVPMEY